MSWRGRSPEEGGDDREARDEVISGISRTQSKSPSHQRIRFGYVLCPGTARFAGCLVFAMAWPIAASFMDLQNPLASLIHVVTACNTKSS